MEREKIEFNLAGLEIMLENMGYEEALDSDKDKTHDIDYFKNRYGIYDLVISYSSKWNTIYCRIAYIINENKTASFHRTKYRNCYKELENNINMIKSMNWDVEIREV